MSKMASPNANTSASLITKVMACLFQNKVNNLPRLNIQHKTLLLLTLCDAHVVYQTKPSRLEAENKNETIMDNKSIISNFSVLSSHFVFQIIISFN